MKLLLDTHIWIWSLLDPDKLSERVLEELTAPDNELWLSSISIWELLILVEKGRVQLDLETDEWLGLVLEEAPMKEAPITYEIARQSRSLDLPRQDPADRFIAATAKVLGLTLVTADQQLLDSKDFKVLANK